LKPSRMTPWLFFPLGGILDVSHMMFCVVPTSQVVPGLGWVMAGVTTMSSLRLMAAGAGDAVAEETRARAERRAVKSCIANVV